MVVVHFKYNVKIQHAKTGPLIESAFVLEIQWVPESAIQDVSEELAYGPLQSVLGPPAPLSKEQTYNYDNEPPKSDRMKSTLNVS